MDSRSTNAKFLGQGSKGIAFHTPSRDCVLLVCGKRIFDHLPEGFDTSGALAKTLARKIEEQHGAAMLLFQRKLVRARGKDPERFDKILRDRIAAFERDAGIGTSSHGTHRVTAAFGLLSATGAFAKTQGILPKGWDCRAACLAGYRNHLSQLPAETPLDARLLAIAQRTATLDLRGMSSMPKLSDSEVLERGAFLKDGKGGRVELLVTDELARRYFPDLRTLKHTSEFKSVNLRDKDHKTKQRQVRKGKTKERFLCFALTTDLVAQNGS